MYIGIERVSFSSRTRPVSLEAILLVGSGRSETTWLADILSLPDGVQQIFEPFNPFWIRDVRDLTDYDRERLRLRSTFLPIINNDAEWIDFMERVLRGQGRAPWTDSARTSSLP